VEENRDRVLAVSHAITCTINSTHNSIRKYFVGGNLVTAAPSQYSSAIRLCSETGQDRSKVTIHDQ